MLKMEKEYNELYGDVPIDSLERIDYLLENKNLKKSKLRVYDEIKRILQWMNMVSFMKMLI